MTSFFHAAARPRPGERGSTPSYPSVRDLPVAVALGALLALALTLGKAIAVWRTGIFYDPDDAMRSVEVRDFLAGQGWFDLVPHRLSPDHPFVMHWSRLVDLLLAAPMVALRSIVEDDTAERIVRLAEPALLYVTFLWALASLARGLIGRWGPLAAALLAAGGLELVGDFVPGHIHHHALQVTLLVILVKAICDGLDPARPRQMALAGALAALSLGVNLQNMPFVAAAAGTVAVLWAIEGAALDRALRWFATGLMAGTATVFAVQVPPGHYLAQTCDAFAAPHLLAAWAGGAGLLALSAAAPLLRQRSVRFAAAAALGVLVLVLVKLTYPACLGDPYAQVDPLLRDKWLSEVGEAMPLGALLARDPAGTVPIAAALLLGLGATVLAAIRSRGTARRRWAVVATLNAVAVLGALWEVRVAASAEALSSLGAARVLYSWFGQGRASSRRFGTLLCFLAGLALTQAGWTAAVLAARGPGPTPSRARAGLPPVDTDACFEPSSYDGLRNLPPGLVLSGIDVGSHILAHTADTALAAPYHRNAYGNKVALLAFAAAPDAAERLVRDAGVRYVALCSTSTEMQDFATREPQGLAGQVLGGHVPNWLRAAAPDAGPMQIYEVVPKA